HSRRPAAPEHNFHAFRRGVDRISTFDCYRLWKTSAGGGCRLFPVASLLAYAIWLGTHRTQAQAAFHFLPASLGGRSGTAAIRRRTDFRPAPLHESGPDGTAAAGAIGRIPLHHGAVGPAGSRVAPAGAIAQAA